MRRRIRNKKGFTLIELIVVIAILAILAAIAVPRLGAFRQDAQDSANQATAAIVFKAWQSHEAANNNVNPTLAELNAYLDTPLAALPAVTEDGAGNILTITVNGVTYP